MEKLDISTRKMLIFFKIVRETQGKFTVIQQLLNETEHTKNYAVMVVKKKFAVIANQGLYIFLHTMRKPSTIIKNCFILPFCFC